MPPYIILAILTAGAIAYFGKKHADGKVNGTARPTPTKDAPPDSSAPPPLPPSPDNRPAPDITRGLDSDSDPLPNLYPKQPAPPAKSK